MSLMIIDSHPDNSNQGYWTICVTDLSSALMNSMMRNRFSEIVQKGTPPFVYGSPQLRLIHCQELQCT
ncbi:MAG: hypothetical protein MZV63_21835 [Marinilabiliales bacterium]|nr:hypothetical protein [Marinilabiliales bacterium]